MRQHPGIKEAIVAACADRTGEKRLVAHVLPDYESESALEDPSVDSWQTDQVSQWQVAWDETYNQGTTEGDPDFDIAGWNSSYTGEPIPPEEMREWVKILSRGYSICGREMCLRSGAAPACYFCR